MHIPDYPGATMISRGSMPKNLGEIVEKALGDKLPKLVATAADKRVLLVERQHISLGDTRILTEIERQAPKFPQLKDIDEVCIVDTSIWESENWVYFRRFDERGIIETMAFKNGELERRYYHGR
jgi:hypothetical protein